MKKNQHSEEQIIARLKQSLARATSTHQYWIHGPDRRTQAHPGTNRLYRPVWKAHAGASADTAAQNG